MDKEAYLNHCYKLAKTSHIIYWAKKTLNWSPLKNENNGKEAWYQYVLAGCFVENLYKYPDDYWAEELRDKPVKQFAWRIGRQCLAKGSIVHTRDGKLIRIEDSPDAWKVSDNKEIYEVKVEGGYAIRCTGNHPIMTDKGWVNASELKRNDKVVVLDSWNKFGQGLHPYHYEQKRNKYRTDKHSGTLKLTEDLCELLGWITADGSVLRPGQSSKFINTNNNYLKRVEFLILNNFKDITPTWYKKGNGYDLLLTTKGDKSLKNSFNEFIRKTTFDKAGFSYCLNNATKTQLAAFLRAMFASDGHVHVRKNGKIELGLACGIERVYADFFRELLNKFGIHMQIKSEFKEGKHKHTFYKLIGCGKQNIERFKNEIGDIPDKPFPEIIKKCNYPKDKQSVEDLDKETTNSRLVLSSKLIGHDEVWNIEYPNKGWFFSGGIKTKNSGKSELLSISSLYLALCRPIKIIKENFITGVKETFLRGPKTIVASADADKARTNFDRVMTRIHDSQLLTAALEAGTVTVLKHPFPELTFYIEGWNEPASITFRGPGAKGQTARSKTFDYKLYDEADYILPEFFEAELATGINASEHGITVLSSTPQGKREHFFNACFVKNTPVILSDGSKKNIQDIATNDMVFDRHGNPSKVLKTLSRDYDQIIVQLKTTLDDAIITCTRAHKFMAFQKKLRYCGLCEQVIWDDDKECTLGGTHSEQYYLPEVKPEYMLAGLLSVGDFLAIPKNIYPHKDLPPYSKLHGDFIYVPITHMTTERLDEANKSVKVYNLTVEGDHSYCVNYFGVANCTNPEWNYMEFYVPSHENPNYTKQFDVQYRREHTMVNYQHEILADWGVVEEGVFDWTFFARVFNDKSEIIHPNGELEIVPAYKGTYNEDFKKKPEPNEYEMFKISSDTLKNYGFSRVLFNLSRKMPPVEGGCIYWFGADEGYSADPSELVVFKEKNGIMKMILRIRLEHIEYTKQADLIAFLDDFYKFERLGMDAGNNGQMLEQVLKAKEDGWNKFAKHNFEKRLIAINFSRQIPVKDNFNIHSNKKNTNTNQNSKKGRETKLVSAKQFMTDSIILWAQNKRLILPGLAYDQEPFVEVQFRNHTYHLGGQNNMVYETEGIIEDHCLIGDTLIDTKIGKLPIKQIEIGQEVLTRQGWQKVLMSKLTKKDAAVLTVKFSNNIELTGTFDHPVFSKTKQSFVNLGDLEINEEVFDITHLEHSRWQVRVLEIRHEALKQDVYDLTIENAHEFFANGILVHNCIDAVRTAFFAKVAGNLMSKLRTWPVGQAFSSGPSLSAQGGTNAYGYAPATIRFGNVGLGGVGNGASGPSPWR